MRKMQSGIRFSALIWASAPAYAQAVAPYRWQPVATHGMGTLTGIAISQIAPFDVYVKADVGGAYRYDRARDIWLPLLDAMPTGVAGEMPSLDSDSGTGVESIAVDPVQPATAYAVVPFANGVSGAAPYAQYTSAGEVLRTTDRGRSWAPLGLAAHNIAINPNGNYRSDTGERLGIDPRAPTTFYFASRVNGLWRKSGDADWTQLGGGLPDPTSLPNYYLDGQPDTNQPGFTFVAFDSTRPGDGAYSATIYVGVTGSGIWASHDGGATWANTGGPADNDRGIVAGDGTLYVGARSSLQKHTGAGWADISPIAGQEFNGLTADPANPSTLMAVSNNQVFRSIDAGANWVAQRLYMGSTDPLAGTPVNPSAPGYYLDFASNYASAIAIDATNPGAAWWTNGFGVARSDDVADTPAATWSWHMAGMEELVVNVLRVPPLPKRQGGADLIAGDDDMLGFRYADRRTVPSAHINPVGDPVPPNSQGVDGDWTVFPVPFPHVAGITGLDYAAGSPAHLAFVGQHQWQFIGIHGTSADNGRTWQAFPTVPQDTLYDAQGNAYAASAIAGQLAMSPVNFSNFIWAPSYGSFPQVTFDAGAHWQLMTNLDHGPAPAPGGPITTAQTHYTYIQPTFANAISPYLSSTLLAADRADPTGLTFYYLDFTTMFVSHDGGTTWHQGASGGAFPEYIVHPTIVSNPARQGDIWLAFARNPGSVQGHPLFHSIDGGLSFGAVAGVASCEHLAFGASAAQGGPPTLFIAGRVGADTIDAIYKSPDLGANWVRISNPAREAFPAIIAMEGDMRQAGLVYIGLGGRGVLYGLPK